MKRRTSFTLQVGFAALAMANPCAAQWQNFMSGSTNSDGALDFSSTPSGTTVTFDPTSYNPPLNPSGNNIFNFTYINIPSGVTVRLSGRNLTGPIYWLASGNVTINGSIDLSGENGAGPTNVPTNRTIAYPGAGGYAGGLGGMSGGPAPTSGQGPAGGAGGTVGGNGGFSGNSFLVPLVGGSGGGGSLNYAGFNNTNGIAPAGYFGTGGGAGGGAILIASSASIACNGSIDAQGGASGGETANNGGAGGILWGAGGSGGAVHLIAPAISGACSIYTYGGLSFEPSSAGASGFIRVESAHYTGSFNFGSGPYGPSFQGSNYAITSTPNLYLPTITPGTIKAISVNGLNLPTSPTGSFVTPDVAINTPNSVSVGVQASNIPLGTVVTLRVTSDESADTTTQCPGLTGTLASATTTCTVVFPAGFSRGYITASW